MPRLNRTSGNDSEKMITVWFWESKWEIKSSLGKKQEAKSVGWIRVKAITVCWRQEIHSVGSSHPGVFSLSLKLFASNLRNASSAPETMSLVLEIKMALYWTNAWYLEEQVQVSQHGPDGAAASRLIHHSTMGNIEWPFSTSCHC